MNGLIVNVALTGCVHYKCDNPALPVTPREVAADARRCRDAGATMFHLHARNRLGGLAWGVGVYRDYVQAVREAVPDCVIVASCSGRHNSDLSDRQEAIWAGPDMASLSLGSFNHKYDVNVNNPGTIRALAKEMLRYGVRPELEAFEIGHIAFADRLIQEGLLRPPYWFNLFFGNVGTLPAERGLLSLAVSMLPEEALWAGAGVGRFQFAVNRWAVEMGGHVRVGLEDNLWMDEARTEPATNPRLVERIVAYARSLGREPASAKEALGL